MILKGTYLKDIDNNISSMNGSLINTFVEVVKELLVEYSIDEVVKSSSLKTQIQRLYPCFIGYGLQDSQEFLSYLLKGA